MMLFTHTRKLVVLAGVTLGFVVFGSGEAVAQLGGEPFTIDSATPKDDIVSDKIFSTTIANLNVAAPAIGGSQEIEVYATRVDYNASDVEIGRGARTKIMTLTSTNKSETDGLPPGSGGTFSYSIYEVEITTPNVHSPKSVSGTYRFTYL